MVNPFEMMKNLKNVEANAAKMKEELGRISATGSSGGNIVKVTLNGKFEMVSIEIDPIAQGDVPMLQDLIVAAHHNAMEKIQEAIKEKSGSLLIQTAGADLKSMMHQIPFQNCQGFIVYHIVRPVAGNRNNIRNGIDHKQ